MKQISQYSHKPVFWRNLVQGGFLLWCIYLGFQFSRFVAHFVSQGKSPLVTRPPGIEAFLPIGALVSLKNWILNGIIDPVHPAALVLFLTFLALALLTRKSFCSWICPVGTLSEWLWRSSERLIGRRIKPWRWLDLVLRSAKYLLLFFFVKLILFGMPGPALKGFLSSPYWALSDVKMLHFFTNPSTLSIVIVLTLAVLSFFIRQFWCRYLCPYGALLGFFSFLSPSRITRDINGCTGCGSCDRACPASINVSRKKQVYSMECTGCLSCVQSCPEHQVLQMGLFGSPRVLPVWLFPALVLLVFTFGVAAGMFSGHWHSTLSYRDYMQLIPMLNRF
ncbi:4Fe-4S binding domain-containing protein [Desulfuromusa kysingii]|uniref:4Fe-4S binding domain-containing protein n=1 Tax=Desulfuromusa kysingii TaxID=37625 RepID=A0A1H4DQV8_9BACT|nr:4Fe-4S binding protein [Desulfuromusa kysingii]SEA75153.1 4Fe-4S binding domain-containing protein [Desulfuromusa kysingii]